MRPEKIDLLALHRALDERRQSQELTWRELARVLNISASTMARMLQGRSPDVHSFMILVAWLKVPAETFLIEKVT